MAIQRSPDNVEFLKNRAQCYYDMGEYELALQDLDYALTNVNPHDP